MSLSRPFLSSRTGAVLVLSRCLASVLRVGAALVSALVPALILLCSRAPSARWLTAQPQPVRPPRQLDGGRTLRCRGAHDAVRRARLRCSLSYRSFPRAGISDLATSRSRLPLGSRRRAACRSERSVRQVRTGPRTSGMAAALAFPRHSSSQVPPCRFSSCSGPATTLSVVRVFSLPSHHLSVMP